MSYHLIVTRNGVTRADLVNALARAELALNKRESAYNLLRDVGDDLPAVVKLSNLRDAELDGRDCSRRETARQHMLESLDFEIKTLCDYVSQLRAALGGLRTHPDDPIKRYQRERYT